MQRLNLVVFSIYEYTNETMQEKMSSIISFQDQFYGDESLEWGVAKLFRNARAKVSEKNDRIVSRFGMLRQSKEL